MKLTLFAVLNTVVCASCSSSVCDVGASRCAGTNELEVCSVGSAPEAAAHWERSECLAPSTMCVEASTGASYCVADAPPNPACPAAQDPGAKREPCDGDAPCFDRGHWGECLTSVLATEGEGTGACVN